MKEFWWLIARVGLGVSALMVILVIISYRMHLSNKATLKDIKKQLILNGKDPQSVYRTIEKVNLPAYTLAY